MTEQVNGRMLMRWYGVTGMNTMAAPDSNSNTDAGPGHEYPGTPRWVKLFGITVIILVLTVIIILFIGGHTSPVQHGP